ncbi:vWA domain-containing protein [Nocardioides silvaticus]|uniref:vWA domain-containing protein n=1 Tax=Nocardioides silvaticus TaxID=2201891 RepID=UPI001FEAE053|nr:VWA domain-containing protein [Nocardioides silvaticus]
MISAVRGGDELLLGFTRALRSAGVPVTADRARAYLDAVALVGIGDRSATRVAGRATLCGGPDDLAAHDRVFDEWFSVDLPRPSTDRAVAIAPSPSVDLVDLDDEGAGEGEGSETFRVLASTEEVLRHRDVATLTAAERQRLAALFAGLPVRRPVRRAARYESWHRGTVDASRTLRTSLRRMGEPAEIRWRRRRTRPRRVVLLVDVSGSMSGYADALLRVAHRVVTGAGGGVEVFTVGTRLTRITRALHARDPEVALVAAGETVPDWSGGTRLGETLQVFLDRWGQRGLARGAVVVVLSDGWERGDPALLAEQVRRLGRLAHRVVWVNPHRGKTGYEPVQRGVVAVLPHVDAFLAGHSLATYAELMEVIADA